MNNLKCPCHKVEEVWVEVPARLSHCNRDIIRPMLIDKCLAPIIIALNREGIKTDSSCCGHGNIGEINLRDGRILLIFTPDQYSQCFAIKKKCSQLRRKPHTDKGK